MRANVNPMIDVRRLQTRLGVTADSVMGRNTWRALFARMGADVGTSVQLALGANVHCPKYGITDMPLRLAHFLGQTAHESGGYRWMQEIWGPTAAQKGYEGRKDLGNTVAGDGRRYAGRGILQITGRTNYYAAGNRLGFDFLEHPEIAAMPAMSVLTACDYWETRGLNALCDADNIEAVTRKINGGTNGLSDRIARTNKAKELLL